MTWLRRSVPPVRFQLPERVYMNAAAALEFPIHGVVTVGGMHELGRFGMLSVLMLNEPPVMVTPPSNTTLPPKKVTAVPLPIESGPAQSTSQLPSGTTTAPLGLQL